MNPNISHILHNQIYNSESYPVYENLRNSKQQPLDYSARKRVSKRVSKRASKRASKQVNKLSLIHI